MNPAQLLNPKAFAKQKKSGQKSADNARKCAGWQNDGDPFIPEEDPIGASHVDLQDQFMQYLMPHLPGAANGLQQTSSQGPPQPRVQTFNPSALLNPRAAAASSSTRGDDLSQQESPATGAAHLYERMHNVENREASTPRKRKIQIVDDDDDDGPQKKSFNMNGGRNGGVIGEHMKKEREQIASAAGPPIDLTNEDDQDVVIVDQRRLDQPKPNEQITLGQFSCKAAVHRIPDASERSKAAVGAHHWPQIRVKWRLPPGGGNNNVIELLTKTDMYFGKLDFKAAGAVTPLLKPSVGCDMTVFVESRAKDKSEIPGADVSKSLSIVCVLYAPRSKAMAIGKHLSQRQIFLSGPTALGGIHKEYHNPQYPPDYRLTAGDPSQRKPQLQGQTIAVTSRTVEEMRRDASQLFDSLVKHEDLPEKEADPKLISTELLSHQKKALHFLTDHEDPFQEGATLWKEDRNAKGQDYWYHIVTGQQYDKKPDPLQGGILADMMGLGKTLSILSLVAATIPEAKAFSKQPSPEELHCERNVGCTLIVCPKSVMANWTEQIKTHTVAGKVRVYSYHGTSRTQEVNELAKYHVVLTTYNTVAAEFNAKGKPLAAANWFRIVLDEAHSIRNQNTAIFKACSALHAERRWAVTGTPVQNGLNDLGALIRFLKVKPFDEGSAWAQHIMAPFKLANTDVVQHLRLLVDSITLRRVKDTIDLPDRTIEITKLLHTDEERKWYAKVAGESNKKLKVMAANNSLKGKSYAHVLKSIGTLRMLCAHSLDMFSDEDRADIKEGADAANAIELGDEPELDREWQFISERNAYENLQMMSDSDVDRCSKCDRKVVPQKEADESQSEQSDDEDDETMGYLTPCLHLICNHCKDDHIAAIKPHLTTDDYHTCQYCDSYVRFGLYELLYSQFNSFLDARSAKIKTPKGRKWDESSYSGPHTKVRALLEDLRASAVETSELPAGEPPVRSVVFSGWTSYLDLIEVALDAADIGYLRLDGKMSIRARTNVLSEFQTDPTKTVLLVSIKAGGQGLNFTTANKVYMMEPQFNPGVEEQAIDRVHRLGQTRPVSVKRYIMTNTIEEGILELQNKKKRLAEMSMNRKVNAQEVRKENLEALKDLFK